MSNGIAAVTQAHLAPLQGLDRTTHIMMPAYFYIGGQRCMRHRMPQPLTEQAAPGVRGNALLRRSAAPFIVMHLSSRCSPLIL
jgi:hypothetical protein